MPYPILGRFWDSALDSFAPFFVLRSSFFLAALKELPSQSNWILKGEFGIQPQNTDSSGPSSQQPAASSRQPPSQPVGRVRVSVSEGARSIGVELIVALESAMRGWQISNRKFCSTAAHLYLCRCPWLCLCRCRSWCLRLSIRIWVSEYLSVCPKRQSTRESRRARRQRAELRKNNFYIAQTQSQPKASEKQTAAEQVGKTKGKVAKEGFGGKAREIGVIFQGLGIILDMYDQYSWNGLGA